MYEEQASATNPVFQTKLRELFTEFLDIKHNYKDTYCQFRDHHVVLNQFPTQQDDDDS